MVPRALMLTMQNNESKTEPRVPLQPITDISSINGIM